MYRITPLFTCRAIPNLLALIMLGVCVVSAAAQDTDAYPTKPIRLIVPFPAGGGGDTLARLVMTRVGKELGQPMVVENLPGAGGNIGSQKAAREPADGYTVLYGTNGTFGINHTLYKNAGFDPMRDFMPVSQLTRIAALVTVRAGLPVDNFPDLLKLIRSSPGKLTYGSAGNGTTSHLATELLKAAAGVSIVHVPYRGGAPALTDLLGGQIDILIDVIPNVAGAVQGGRIKALAVTTASRVGSLPSTPTVAESGVPGFDVSAWDAIFVPKGTPSQVVQRLQAAVRKALDDPQIRQQLAERGAEPAAAGPEALTQFVKSELIRWGQAVKGSGATIE
ncbi:tripartite tricarboxylate transporter substrate binding protein [Variovorax sp. J31P207]|uniref:Bug family tripartite tricarboxylate transporter substrate binding protein n=1 Tax=Variovorax sp. J31P207 TaxID=3053510 RepID=UPI002575A13B|nr:tripartite tricarboxylate transporter substrate binding protein [Variovorax sp. J31P207]MDM0066910.1 tripartite tricarboxylate transporter substrate binding protein [Variovorax sp. J31P207]